MKGFGTGPTSPRSRGVASVVLGGSAPVYKNAQLPEVLVRMVLVVVNCARGVSVSAGERGKRVVMVGVVVGGQG